MKTKKKIKKILKNFDFEKVHNVMAHLNWTWYDTDGKVPSIDQLKELAKKLLYHVAEEERFYSSATGGFKATKYENGTLELEFILASWMVEED